jgi:hypothetical protein
MLIIDSLLNFIFFLSGEVQENLSFFCLPQAAHIATGRGSASSRHNLEPSYERSERNMAKKACSSFLMTATTACSGAFP